MNVLLRLLLLIALEWLTSPLSTAWAQDRDILTALGSRRAALDAEGHPRIAAALADSVLVNMEGGGVCRLQHDEKGWEVRCFEGLEAAREWDRSIRSQQERLVRKLETEIAGAGHLRNVSMREMMDYLLGAACPANLCDDFPSREALSRFPTVSGGLEHFGDVAYDEQGQSWLLALRPGVALGLHGHGAPRLLESADVRGTSSRDGVYRLLAEPPAFVRYRDMPLELVDRVIEAVAAGPALEASAEPGRGSRPDGSSRPPRSRSIHPYDDPYQFDFGVRCTVAGHATTAAVANGGGLRFAVLLPAMWILRDRVSLTALVHGGPVLRIPATVDYQPSLLSLGAGLELTWLIPARGRGLWALSVNESLNLDGIVPVVPEVQVRSAATGVGIAYRKDRWEFGARADFEAGSRKDDGMRIPLWGVTLGAEVTLFLKR